uniref:ANF_receptor domain-containing protein n=1 Tax=Heterorhabditis bacteriophora TaxID=37862 RepID=A0A1I7WWF3_HETBA
MSDSLIVYWIQPDQILRNAFGRVSVNYQTLGSGRLMQYLSIFGWNRVKVYDAKCNANNDYRTV